MKQYDLIVLPGRFEPLHNGHIENTKIASKLSDNLLFVVGSINQPRTIKNPFTFSERKQMIFDVYGDTVDVVGIEDDLYNDSFWVSQVRQKVTEVLIRKKLPHNAKVAIIGHEKDDSSYYLHLFPSWDFVPTDGYTKVGDKVIDATKIRQLYFEGHLSFIESVLHKNTFKFMSDFSKTKEYQTLVEEYNFIKKYKESWSAAPYAPTFNTVDAVVVQSDNILLIQRKSSPGKDLWALPGGFMNAGTNRDSPHTFTAQKAETFEQACVRELIEETNIKVPERTLKQLVSTAYQKCFDHPDRSLRGRTITQAFLLQLSGTDLPKVKASDDAKDARWFSFADVEKMSDQLFEDHFSIIKHMIRQIK